MKTKLFITFCMGFILMIATNTYSQNSLSNQLEGSWEGTGTLMGAAADFKMNWHRVLNDQFLKLDFTSRRRANDLETLFQANAMYRLSDEKWQGTWFDSRGFSFEVTGTVENNMLTVEWGSPEIEQGRTVYEITGENEMTVTDYVNRNGTYSKFGEAFYHKIDNPLKSGEPKAIGIGGIFFKSNNPVETREWYKKHLGLISNEQGGSYVWRKFDDPDAFGFTVWHVFSERDEYFDFSSSEFMINYRVNNLDGLIKKLAEEDVQFVGEVEEYPFGKFAWILDSNGQKIELWEPYDADFFNVLNTDGSQLYNPSN